MQQTATDNCTTSVPRYLKLPGIPGGKLMGTFFYFFSTLQISMWSIICLQFCVRYNIYVQNIEYLLFNKLSNKLFNKGGLIRDRKFVYRQSTGIPWEILGILKEITGNHTNLRQILGKSPRNIRDAFVCSWI